MSSFVFDVLPVAYQTAFRGGTTESETFAGLAKDVHLEHAFVEQMHWHELKGKRSAVALTLVSDRHAMRRLLVLCLAAEPLRALLRCLFACSSF